MTEQSNTRSGSSVLEEQAEHVGEITQDIVVSLTEFAQEKPLHAALYCLGIGFILGWKLKPW